MYDREKIFYSKIKWKFTHSEPEIFTINILLYIYIYTYIIHYITSEFLWGGRVSKNDNTFLLNIISDSFS